jgi:isoquinoline 1-oxidoreductase beta subunit
MTEAQVQNTADAPPLSRRGFLIGMSAVALSFGIADATLTAHAAPSASPATFEPTIWYSIDGDGIVTVNIIRAEMGQHVGTALARIVADELEVEWDKVKINAVDSDPKWGLMMTGGSLSVWQSFPLFSRAGAAGRIALLEEGARLLGVSAGQFSARNGAVIAFDRRISYGEIVRRNALKRSFTTEQLAQLPIKPATERRLIGRDTLAIDIPAKTNGTTRYGIDAWADGMVYARPKIPPTRNGAIVLSVDDTAAKKVKGYLQSLVLEDPSNTVPGWVMVLATSYPAAIRAADLVKVEWRAGNGAKVSERDILEHGAQQIADPNGGVLVVDDEGLEAAFRTAHSKLERTYTTNSVLHAQLEPVNALAFERDGNFEIHTGNQWQSLILPVLAQALQLPQERIVMRTYAIGGGFGRRLNGDYTVPAALAAKAIRKPVKLLLTRPDDMRFDSFRSPSVQTLRMAFDAAGRVTAMDHHASAGWPTEVMAAALMPKGLYGEPYDGYAIAGADHWYSVGAQRARTLSNHVANKAFRPGWLRAVGPGWTNWAVETFMDEAAHAVGVDPVTFRVSLLDARGRNAGSAPNAVGGAKRQAPSRRAATCRTESRLGCCHAEGHRSGNRHHVRPGARYADLDRLRGAGPCRASDWRGQCGEAGLGDRRRHGRASGWRAGAGRERSALGPEHGAARRHRIHQRPGQGHKPRHLYSASYGRCARNRNRVRRECGVSGGSRRAGDDGGGSGNRKCDLCRGGREAPSFAYSSDRIGCGFQQTLSADADPVRR